MTTIKKITVHTIGAILAIIAFAMFSCSAPEPQPEPVDWAAYNDSSAKALEDSLREDSLLKANAAKEQSVKVLPQEGRIQIEMIMNRKF